MTPNIQMMEKHLKPWETANPRMFIIANPLNGA